MIYRMEIESIFSKMDDWREFSHTDDLTFLELLAFISLSTFYQSLVNMEKQSLELRAKNRNSTVPWKLASPDQLQDEPHAEIFLAPHCSLGRPSFSYQIIMPSFCFVLALCFQAAANAISQEHQEAISFPGQTCDFTTPFFALTQELVCQFWQNRLKWWSKRSDFTVTSQCSTETDVQLWGGHAS